jgi:hypothetical protein
MIQRIKQMGRLSQRYLAMLLDPQQIRRNNVHTQQHCAHTIRDFGMGMTCAMYVVTLDPLTFPKSRRSHQMLVVHSLLLKHMQWIK